MSIKKKQQHYIGMNKIELELLNKVSVFKFGG
jgi:hypothetical protein